jgi:hypothetical protein
MTRPRMHERMRRAGVDPDEVASALEADGIDGFTGSFEGPLRDLGERRSLAPVRGGPRVERFDDR